MIESQGKSDNVKFDELNVIESDYTALDAGKGIKIRRQQFEDLDGNGIAVAEALDASDLRASGLLAPIPDGATHLERRGRARVRRGFPTSQGSPYSPFRTSIGTYARTYSPSADRLRAPTPALFQNPRHRIRRRVARRCFREREQGDRVHPHAEDMPEDGRDPRFLVPKYRLVPPALPDASDAPHGCEVLRACIDGRSRAPRTIAGVLKKWGLNTPVVAPELSAAFSGTSADDTIFGTSAVSRSPSSQLGALLYVDREPFKITYYTGQGGGTGVDAILDRAQELEWHTHGRNVSGYGHPYALFKIKAA